MVNGKTVVAGVVVIGGIALLAFLILPLFSNATHGLDIVFTDEDGNKVPMAFMNAGEKIVTGFSANLWWTVIGSNVDLSTLAIDGTLKVYILSMYDKWHNIDEQPFSKGNEGAADDSYSKSYDFDTLLASYMSDDYKTTGWIILVDGSITASMSDTEGNVLDPQTYSDSAQFLITWYEGSFVLEAGVEVTV